MDADQIIIQPLLTEKTTALREKGTYCFVVNARANKIQIKNAVRSLYGVMPIGCNTISVHGKPKRVRYRKGYSPSWKKAMVTLKTGDSIPIFEGA